jgi:hypothetical protein
MIRRPSAAVGWHYFDASPSQGFRISHNILHSTTATEGNDGWMLHQQQQIPYFASPSGFGKPLH